MKEKLAKLKPSAANLSVYLFMAALLFRLLPYLLETLILLAGKKPLAEPLCFVLEYAVILLLPLSAVWLWRAAGYPDRKTGIAGAAVIALAYVLETAGGTVLQEKYLTVFLDMAAAYYGLYALLLLVVMALMLWALPGSRKKMKGNLVICGILLGRWIILFAADALLTLCGGLILVSFGSNILLRAVTAFADACALTLIFKQIAVSEVKKNRQIRLIAAPVGIAACLVAQLLLLKTDPIEQIAAGIAENIAYGAEELVLGNVETAAQWFHRAEERRNAWEYTTEAVSEDLLSGGKAATTLETRYLYWQYTEDYAAMENCLLEEDPGIEFAAALLQVYAEEGTKISDNSRAIRRDILTMMVAQGVFTDDVLKLEDLEGKRLKLAKKLAEFDKVGVYCDAVDVLAATGKDGKVSKAQMEQMLEYAEQNPKDLCLQYLAFVYGCACKGDGARHYDRTMDAAERFVSLYEMQKHADEEARAQCTRLLIDRALELGLYERALEYCDRMPQQTEEVLMIRTQCLMGLKRTDECYEAAKQILELNPENPAAVYYCAVSELQEREKDPAICRTLDLSRIVQEAEGEERHQAEVMFYDLIQRQSFNDAGYNTKIYSSLTEEQKTLIGQDAFYEAYLEAAYNCFDARDYEKALAGVEKVLAMEPGLSQANYLKGCIYFGMEEYEKAAEAYRASLSVDDTSATAWYSLGNAYDALGRYAEAYDACCRVTALLPDTDHLFDPYGVAIHNNNLKLRLAQELGIRED